MNTSTPVLPLVANGYTGHYGDHCDGLEGKDAVLIHSVAASNDRNFNASKVADLRVENLNNRFEIERAFRDLQVNQERLERENQRVVVEEAQRTRDMIAAQDSARAERERINGQFAALEKLISAIPTK